MRSRTPLKCHDCGAHYAGLGCDLALPDQQWKALFPEESGVLCANCICQRATGLGATVVMAWLDNLDYSKSVRPKDSSSA